MRTWDDIENYPPWEGGSWVPCIVLAAFTHLPSFSIRAQGTRVSLFPRPLAETGLFSPAPVLGAIMAHPGSPPVDFGRLPLDLGTGFHDFLCNSATVGSKRRHAAGGETAFQGVLLRAQRTLAALGSSLFGLPHPNVQVTEKGLLVGVKSPKAS